MRPPLIILGNGPSLKGFDFKRLAAFDTIGMNAAYRYWFEIGWFPRYYICLDKVVGVSHKDQISKLIRDSDDNGIELFLLRRNLITLFDESIQKSNRVLDFDALRGSIDAFDPVPFTTGSHAALFGALLGYREMLLMGIDCNYVERVAGAREQEGILEIVETPSDNPNYFFAGYQSAGDRYNIPNPVPEMHIESWHAVAPVLAEKGIAIWNGSAISRLTEFPFRSFDDIEARAVADSATSNGGLSLPLYARYQAPATGVSDREGTSHSVNIVRRLVPASFPVVVANWAQRHNTPVVLALGRFAVWCSEIIGGAPKVAALAGLSLLVVLAAGLISAELRAPLWSVAGAALLTACAAAVFGFMRASLLRRARTHEVALALWKARTAGSDAEPSPAPGRRHAHGPSEIPGSVECVWPARAALGEGCCWDARSKKVFWTDIKGARLHALALDGARQTWELPFRIGSVGIPPAGWTPPAGLAGEVLIAAGDSGLVWLGLKDQNVSAVTIVHPEAHLPENRFNDGKFGPDGRYWAGTMHDPETSVTGSLYAFCADGSYAIMDSGYHVPNGPAFSPDGTTLYHTDSARQALYAFDLTSEDLLATKRVFVQFEPGEGNPDGMTTDSLGNIWIAMWDGSRIEKVSPEGKRAGCVRLPTRRPTSCTFAGEGRNVLYVSTAAIGAADDDKLAGGLFKIELGA